MVQTRAGTWRHKLVVGVLFSTMVLAGVWQSPVSAEVSAVEGSASNCSSEITFFGNPQQPIAPTASVTLPPSGSATPITETAPCTIRIFIPPNNAPGPIILSAASVAVSTEGTTGPTGSVTSTANATDVGTDANEALQATSISATCTASEAGVTGDTTVTGGTVVTDQNAGTTAAVPENPDPGFAIEGVNGAGDRYRYVFNEQTVNADGSITVTAVHLVLLGPNATGDVYLGQVVCGVTSDGGGATTTTSDPDGATTTTMGNGGATTTTMGNGGATTTTMGNGGATTTTMGNGGATTTTTQPAPGPGGCERPTDFVGALIFDIFRGISDLLANLGITGFEDFGCDDDEDSGDDDEDSFDFDFDFFDRDFGF